MHIKRLLTHNFLPFFWLSCCLIAIYSPPLLHQYLFHDDVNFFTRTPGRMMPPSQMFNFFIGRFLGAVIMTLSSWSIHFVEDLNKIRFIALINTGIVAFISYRFLRDYFQNRVHTFLSAILIATLPGFQVMVSYAGIIFHSFASSLGSLAAFSILQISVNKSFKECLMDKFMWLGIVLFFLGISTYAPTAMFYWVFVLIVILSSIHKPVYDLKIKLFNFFACGVIGMGLYAVILKSIQHLSAPYVTGMYNPYNFNLDITSKLAWFIREPLLNALNLWRVYPSHEFAVIVLTVILVSAVVHLFLIYIQRKEIFNLTQTSLSTLNLFFILILVIVFSFLPSILALGQAPFYRCTLNLAAMIVVLLIWSFQNWLFWVAPRLKSYILTIFLTLLCFYASFKAYNNILYLRILPSEIEMSYLENKIDMTTINNYKRIHIIQPEMGMIMERYDEFATPTSRYDQDMIGFVSSVFIEKAKDVLDIQYLIYDWKNSLVTYFFKVRKTAHILPYKLQITVSNRKDAPITGSETLIIDFNELYRPGGKLNYLTR